ncbi:hypothetical protein KC726_05015 [Candidatus Woesebacteria bacterium]|nr:hypothetical protein [Candidatus Woesebacteria bacterium]
MRYDEALPQDSTLSNNEPYVIRGQLYAFSSCWIEVPESKNDHILRIAQFQGLKTGRGFHRSGLLPRYDWHAFMVEIYQQITFFLNQTVYVGLALSDS